MGRDESTEIALPHERDEEIEYVVWVDEEAGEVGVYKLRGRTLADRPDADLRVRGHRSGELIVFTEHVPVTVIDTREPSPTWRDIGQAALRKVGIGG